MKICLPRADPDLFGSLVGKGPLTWVMVVAAIRRSDDPSASHADPFLRYGWKGERFGTNHEPTNHEPQTHGRG